MFIKIVLSYYITHKILAGFAHKDNQQTIDLNCVRLCFQVFLEGTEKGAFTFALRPVVSDPIYDKSKLLPNTIFDSYGYNKITINMIFITTIKLYK